ncbi:MAG: hypothetical protein HOV87_09985 [Catenulispora sp.]|nr:hypothetical protein [Catenulispora sp.]
MPKLLKKGKAKMGAADCQCAVSAGILGAAELRKRNSGFAEAMKGPEPAKTRSRSDRWRSRSAADRRDGEPQGAGSGS